MTKFKLLLTFLAATLFACTSDLEPTPDASVCGDPGLVLPDCKDLGCDGTQSVPLYCPVCGDNPEQPAPGACFCAAPTMPDGWCYFSGYGQ